MWLPRKPPPPDLSALAPWCPAGVEDCEGLTYIVVDELNDGIAGLVITAWPRVDARGRLRFGREAESTRVAAPAGALRTLRREPVVAGGLDDAQREAMRARPVEIGDVFAARLRAEPAPGDPAAWLQEPVLDLTAPAREVAKAQTSAALSGAMDAGYLDVVAEEMTEDARQ
jgi:hypothetical protein